MLTAIILNYNDAPATLKLYHTLQHYRVVEHIILVDGASTDNSYALLQPCAGPKTTVLLADKNGGYGYGNNIGLRYSQKLGASYALVINPDVCVEESALKSCLDLFAQYPNAAAVAPQMQYRIAAYRKVPALQDMWVEFLVVNRLCNPRAYPKSYFNHKTACEVDALPGSCVLFDLEKFAACGFYDEHIFLYHEELAIGCKLRQKKYISLLNVTQHYAHERSASVKKTLSPLQIKRISLQSHAYYLKNYLQASWGTRALLKLLTPLVYAESLIWAVLKKKRSV